MATLRRYHAPKPLGAHVEKTVWIRSQPRTPRSRRSVRPALTHDAGWDWDGTRILFTEKAFASGEEERDCELCELEQREDEHSGRIRGSLSLLDVARYQVSKRHGKERSSLDDFEVIRVPKVVAISEREPNPADDWALGEWEKLDALGFKRTYAEVAHGLVDGNGPPGGCSRLAPSTAEDDPWECL